MTLPKKQYLIAGVLAIPLLALAMFAARATTDMSTNLSTSLTRPSELTVPAGTAIHVRLNQSLATNQNDSGESFAATLASPVTVNGETVIPAGAPVTGMVVNSKPSGRLKGHAYMTLALRSVEVRGADYDLHTSTVGRQSGDHKKRNIAIIGGGGGGGLLIGALAGGGKGALIGGPVGAGAGVAVAALTGKKHVHIPAETAMTFRLTQPLTVPQKG